MKIQRESLWSRERSAWHKDAARTQIQQRSFLLFGLFALCAILLTFYGASHLGSPGGWAALGGAIACAVAFWGLRTGREWARWAAGGISGLAAVLYAVLLVSAALGALDLSPTQWVMAVWLGVVHAGVAIAFLPARGRQLFRRARTGVDSEAEFERRAPTPGDLEQRSPVD